MDGTLQELPANISEIAEKQRYLYLLDKIKQGKHLTPAEIIELRKQEKQPKKTEPKKQAKPKPKKAKEKHAGGRPTLYDKKYCTEIIEFFNIEPTKEVDIVTTYKDGTTKESTELRAENLRFLSAFARKIGVCHDTLIEWTKTHPEFSEAYKKAKELQKEHLITCGLQGLFNPTSFIFTAKNITDMRDSADLNVGGQKDNPLNIAILSPKERLEALRASLKGKNGSGK